MLWVCIQAFVVRSPNCYYVVVFRPVNQYQGVFGDSSYTKVMATVVCFNLAYEIIITADVTKSWVAILCRLCDATVYSFSESAIALHLRGFCRLVPQPITPKSPQDVPAASQETP